MLCKPLLFHICQMTVKFLLSFSCSTPVINLTIVHQNLWVVFSLFFSNSFFRFRHFYIENTTIRWLVSTNVQWDWYLACLLLFYAPSLYAGLLKRVKVRTYYCVSMLMNVDWIKWMYFWVNEFEVGVNDNIFSVNQQKKVYLSGLQQF